MDLVGHTRERSTWDTKRTGYSDCDGGRNNDNYYSYMCFINALLNP